MDARIIQVGNIPIHSIADVQTAMKCLIANDRLYLTLILAHTKLRDELTYDGINIDQLNMYFFINNKFIDNQQIPAMTSCSVYNYAFSKLIQGNLLKHSDWKEWQELDYL